MEVENVKHNGERLAFIIRKSAEKDAKNFPSPDEDFMQVGYMILKKGTEIEPHVHKIWERIINKTQKIIYMISGKMRVDFYENKKKIDERIIRTGDLIVFLNGGFGFGMLEDSEYIEVKQGPYVDVEKDKEKFTPEED